MKELVYALDVTFDFNMPNSRICGTNVDNVEMVSRSKWYLWTSGGIGELIKWYFKYHIF